MVGTIKGTAIQLADVHHANAIDQVFEHDFFSVEFTDDIRDLVGTDIGTGENGLVLVNTHSELFSGSFVLQFNLPDTGNVRRK